MKSQPDKKERQLHIGKSLRLQVYAWCLVVGVVMLVGGTFAWYTLREREAETHTATVMKPYYLSLRNPNETDVLQLSVGSLLQGNTKQIVFCVSGEEAEQINKDTTAFEYELELVHTDNLALKYEIYSLDKLEESEAENAENVITTEHEETLEDGTVETQLLYWQKSFGSALVGTDVSAERWKQAELVAEDSATDAEADAATEGIVNRGTYISYGKREASQENSVAVDNGLKLEPGEDAYASQYFVLEISWDIVSGFEKYDKETDMIYLLAKAVQPEPE